MQSPEAARAARAYRRRRSGLRVFHIEVDEVLIGDMLVTAKMLDPQQIDDHAAITAALERLIELFCKETPSSALFNKSPELTPILKQQRR